MEREIVTLRFTAMAYGGEALARDENGRVVFVPYAIAGETARVEITDTRRGFARGRVVELLEASPQRAAPPCQHFPPTPEAASAEAHWCGGCQWQHISYAAQLEFKAQVVRDQFARVAKLPDAPVLLTIPAAREWFYRNNMQFVVNAEGALCLQAPDSHTLVPIVKCWIMDEPLKEMFGTLELDPEGFQGVVLRAGENTGDRMLILESDDPAVPEIETDEPVSIAFRSPDATVPLVGKPTLNERIGARTFEISPDAFFQVNTPMAGVLVDLVTGILKPERNETLLDAYCGVGLFGLTLAERVAKVYCVEENGEALDDARDNARDLSNIEFYEGQVEQVLPKLDAKIDVAVVDPPRAGMERAALDALVKLAPRALAYVSCDPATLARDAARLAEQGYHLAQVQPVDLFPQTYHIECVARFDRARQAA